MSGPEHLHSVRLSPWRRAIRLRIEEQYSDIMLDQWSDTLIRNSRLNDLNNDALLREKTDDGPKGL